MDLNAQAYKLLSGAQGPKAHTREQVIAEAVKAAVNTSVRVERYQPDCEYLAQLETANGYVQFLAGVGIVTEGFAKDFAYAADRNMTIAMTKMTSEERQRELVMREKQYAYVVAPPAASATPKRSSSANTSPLFVSPGSERKRQAKGSESDGSESSPKDSDGTIKGGLFGGMKTAMQAPGDADEEAMSRYDQGPDLYDGLTEMGRWVTANDWKDDLLSKDRWLSFVRMVTGTVVGGTVLSVGTIVVVASLDMIPWPVRAGMMLLGGLGLRYGARRGQNRMRNEARARGGDFGHFLTTALVTGGQQVINDFIRALMVAQRATPLPANPVLWMAEKLAMLPGMQNVFDFFGWGQAGAYQRAELRLVANQEVAGYVKRVLADPLIGPLVKGIAVHANFLAGLTVTAGLYYYMIPHHATKYVPNRQRYYLGINSAKTFKRLKKKRDDELKTINDLIGLIRPGPDVAAPPGAGAAVRAAAQAARNARTVAHAGFNARLVGISGHLARILRDREAVTIDPTPAAAIAIPPFRPAPPAPPGAPPPVLPPCPRNPRGPGASAGKPDLEKACCDVEALVIRYRVVCVEIEQLELDVRASCAANGIQINSSLAGFSVVDEAFAQLRL